MLSTFREEKPRKTEVFRGKSNFLTLGELGRTSCRFQAVLLALLHTRIAGEEAGGLQGGAVLLVGQQQSAGHTVTDGAGLAGDAAAGDGGHDV